MPRGSVRSYASHWSDHTDYRAYRALSRRHHRRCERTQCGSVLDKESALESYTGDASVSGLWIHNADGVQADGTVLPNRNDVAGLLVFLLSQTN